MSRTIILFYSFEGSTKRIAMYLAEKMNLPYEEIKVKEFGSTGFIKYLILGSQVVRKKKPELKPLNVNLNDYDTVILGSPIWAGDFTPAIRTLLENGILKDKTIAYFYCHDGGPGKAEDKIIDAVKINNKILSTYGVERTKNNYEMVKDGVLGWARESIK